MSKFIETHDGSFLNLDRVHCLKPTNIDGERGYLAVCGDGEYSCYSTAGQALFPVIPANAGFFLLRVWFDNGPIPGDLSEEINRRPIIGWRMTTLGRPEPVTFDYDDTDSSPHMQAIECPDGQIVMLGSGYGTYKNFDDFVDGVRRRWRMYIEIAAAKKSELAAVP